MDPMAKLKSKFTPPSIIRRPSDTSAYRSSKSTRTPQYDDEDDEGEETPSKRARTSRIFASSRLIIANDDEDDAGTSQPPARAHILNRSLGAKRRSSGSGLQASTTSPSLSKARAAEMYPAVSSLQEEGGPFYLCTWRKPQSKKHKTWDGDAVLIIRENGQKCTLRCSVTGKDLASHVKFGHGKLEAGDELTIGGKEIEIDRQIISHEYTHGPSNSNSSASKDLAPPKPFKPLTRVNVVNKAPAEPSDLSTMGPAKASTFYAKPALKTPERQYSPAKPSGLMNPGQGKVPHPRFDPAADGAIVMKRPDEKHQKRFNRQGRTVVDVVVDPQLAKALRPHQVEGVKFLYEKVMGMHSQGEKGQGVILADEMGLGKTLQTIALIQTLMRQNCYYTSTSCTIERALIVCPLSLVKNWKREFRKWIGSNALSILCIDGDGKGKEDVEKFVRSKAYQVLVIGYEKLRTCVNILKDAQPPIGLIVCDEGHRLKSRDAKTTKMFQELSTPCRIILSGTPIQNDLSEFYAMIDFVVPGLLGEYSMFKKVFEDPIVKSRAQYCSKQVRELGQSRSDALVKVTHDIILRRTADLLAKYLQPKHEMVVFCSPTRLQLDIYRAVLDSSAVRSVLRGEAGNGLMQIGILRKLCNSPELLLKDLESDAESATKGLLGDVLKFFPDQRRRFEAAYSGKILCAVNLLKTIRKTTDDKVVLVSNFTSTLNIMEWVLRKLRYRFVRLDGKTPQDERMDIVSDFNRSDVSSSFVFLLSAKSGGVGLNLIGANRLILFDSDWNPSTDQQAMARIHRDGQKKSCFIYRMLLSGTMDEKIYQRQLSKLGLSDALMNAGAAGGSKRASDAFSQEDLKDIFTLHTDTTCLSHKLLDCDCGGAGGGSESARKARKAAAEAEVAEDPPSGSDSDDDMPGFVAASQHVVNAAAAAYKDQRTKLAALHDWAHYDCYQRPDSFHMDEIIIRVMSDGGNSTLAERMASTRPIATVAELPEQEADPLFFGSQEEIARAKQEKLLDEELPESPSAAPTVKVKQEPGEGGVEPNATKDLGADSVAHDDGKQSFNIDKTPPGTILFVFAKSSLSLGTVDDEEDDAEVE